MWNTRELRQHLIFVFIGSPCRNINIAYFYIPFIPEYQIYIYNIHAQPYTKSVLEKMLNLQFFSLELDSGCIYSSQKYHVFRITKEYSNIHRYKYKYSKLFFTKMITKRYKLEVLKSENFLISYFHILNLFWFNLKPFCVLHLYAVH